MKWPMKVKVLIHSLDNMVAGVENNAHFKDII